MAEKITIRTHVPVTPELAWDSFNTPDAITQWNFASDDWCCPSAEVDLRVSGRHVARMEAKDGSFGFDYAGTYEEVVPHSVVTLRLDNGRKTRTTFTESDEATEVQTTFDADPSQPTEMQRDGWQSILENYAAYVRKAHG